MRKNPKGTCTSRCGCHGSIWMPSDQKVHPRKLKKHSNARAGEGLATGGLRPMASRHFMHFATVDPAQALHDFLAVIRVDPAHEVGAGVGITDSEGQRA